MGPADRAAVQKKLAAQRAWLAEHPEAGAGGGSAAPYYPSGSWYFSNNYPTNGNPPPEPNSANVFGSSHGGGWHYQATKTSVSSSPSIGATDSGFYYYLCGPGSMTFITRSWDSGRVDNYYNTAGDGETVNYGDGHIWNGGKGWGQRWYGYLYDTAYHSMDWEGGTWGTTWWREKATLNANQSANYFIADPYDSNPGLNNNVITKSNFKGDLDYDLKGYGGAFMASVDTQYLPNWAGYGSAEHFVSVSGWNPTGGGYNGVPYVKYADTADQGSTNQNRAISLDDFYNSMAGYSHQPDKMDLF